jgi:hypothetical protein
MSLRRFKQLVALATLLTSAAHGATTLSGDGAVTRFPGGDDAYSGSLTLLQTTQNGGFLLGLSDTRFPIGKLTEGDVDVYHALNTMFNVSGGLSLGESNSGVVHDSTLYKARLALDARIDPKWSVRIADQFIDLDTVHGHLATVGTEFRPTLKWGIDLTGGYALSGTLPDRYGQLVVNWFGTEHLYSGVIFGRTGYDPASLGATASIRRLFEVYAGAAMPVPHGTLSVSIDATNLEGQLRQTLRVGFMEPIK